MEKKSEKRKQKSSQNAGSQDDDVECMICKKRIHEKASSFGTKKAENLCVSRLMALNKQQVNDWYDKYLAMITRLGIKDVPSRIWNLDETGCQKTYTN